MRVAITGTTGLIGTELCDLLTRQGHSVVRVVRDNATAVGDTIRWNPAEAEIDAAAFEGLDAVVHLAGENIAGGRWTAARKRRILNSRVHGTTLLAKTLAALASPPRTLVCASAIGFYGNRGDQQLTESSAPGNGFLPDVCRQWEAACEPAGRAGIRVVNARIGVVLSDRGGALTRMLLPFRLGIGGVLGSGRQYMSWISLEDVTRALLFCVDTSGLEGPVNLVAPDSITNREFTKTLGRVLGRPTVLPVPAAAVRMLIGEMGEDLLLASTRVVPDRLVTAGFAFTHSTIEPALRSLLG